MSERKVLNVSLETDSRPVPCAVICPIVPATCHVEYADRQKYYPPDFDPSKLKRRKGINKDKQMVIRLMAPFSMRCTRCGEYVCKSSMHSHTWHGCKHIQKLTQPDKGKKFNARKETVTDEEYYGIHIFRFYIVSHIDLRRCISFVAFSSVCNPWATADNQKCTHCSGEITFKTDPKNADYQMEHGATRNFENWADADPSGKRVGAMPTAEADDDYDSDGNPREEKLQRDAMADLERSQEQSKREMETMDELADLRQRNARVETRDVDHDTLVAQLHAERISAAEEEQRRREAEEDDAEVAKHFAKFKAGGPNAVASGSKGAKLLLNGQGEYDSNSDAEDSEDDEGKKQAAAALTIKRRPVPAASSSATSRPEPTVASLLAASGKRLDTAAAGAAAARVKRKREGMQKLLGIKKKA